MDTKEIKYYVVDSRVLPEVYLRVMEVKRLLQDGVCQRVNDAVKKMGISRSTYYKYKDSIFDFYNHKSDILTLMVILDNITGTLFRVLDVIAKSNANILTINQNIPKDNAAMVSISIETIRMTEGMDHLVDKIKGLEGVRFLEIVS
jgi:chorismate mutase